MQDISPGLGSSPLTVGVELLQLFEVYRGRHSIADSRDINPDEKSNLDQHCVVHISPRSGQFTTLFTWTRVNSIWSLYSVKVPATATLGSWIPDQVLLTKQVLCDTAIYKTILTNVKIMNLNFLKYAKRWNIWVPGQTQQRLRLIKCCIKILSG